MSRFDDFEDDAKAQSHAYRKRGCAVGILLSTLEETDALSVTKALDNERLTSTAIEAALKPRVAADLLPSSYTINRHRKGTCTCVTV